MRGPAAQAAPPVFVLWYQGTKIQFGGRITALCVKAVNHRPFVVHSLVIDMLIYVITGASFSVVTVELQNNLEASFHFCFGLVLFSTP